MKQTATHLLGLSILCASSALCAASTDVTAVLETRGHFDDAAGLNTDVDDPAIWIHPTDKTQSIVAATLKEGGMDVYNLNGKLLQHIAADAAPTYSPCRAQPLKYG